MADFYAIEIFPDFSFVKWSENDFGTTSRSEVEFEEKLFSTR